MEVDTPANTESNVAPDYETDPENDMNKNVDKNEATDSVEIVESDSELLILDSAKLMPTFYPQPALNPQPQDEIAGPSGLVQAAPENKVEFVESIIRASTPTPNLEMLNQTSDSCGSIGSQVTLNATNLLADHDASMIGQNETIVAKMRKTALKPSLEDVPEEMDEPESEPETSGSKKPENESESQNKNNDEAEWTIVSHKRSKKWSSDPFYS